MSGGWTHYQKWELGAGVYGGWEHCQLHCQICMNDAADADAEARRREEQMAKENAPIQLVTEMPEPEPEMAEPEPAMPEPAHAKRKMDQTGPLGLLPCVVSLVCL